MEIYEDIQIIYIKKKILKISTKNPMWISDSATALSAIEKMNTKGISSLLVARNKDIKKKIKNVSWYNTFTSLPKSRN